MNSFDLLFTLKIVHQNPIFELMGILMGAGVMVEGLAEGGGQKTTVK